MYGLRPPDHVAEILCPLPAAPDAVVIVRFESGAITVFAGMVVVVKVVEDVDVPVTEFVT
jgi:hypothetical protein